MIYKASLDKLAKYVTIIITVLFAAIIISQFLLANQIGFIIPIFITILLSTVYCIAFAYRPIHYIITDEEIIIHRQFSDVIIKKKSIKKVELLPKSMLSFTIRTFGVSGLFGYYGNFMNRKMGRMTWYATKRKDTVLVETTDDEKIILTPDYPRKFIENFSL